LWSAFLLWSVIVVDPMSFLFFWELYQAKPNLNLNLNLNLLQELLGAFLLSSVGALSIHLSPPVRATLLHKVGLWDAFCQVRPKPYLNLPKPVRATLLHKVGLWDAFCQVRPKPYLNLPNQEP